MHAHPDRQVDLITHRIKVKVLLHTYGLASPLLMLLIKINALVFML